MGEREREGGRMCTRFRFSSKALSPLSPSLSTFIMFGRYISLSALVLGALLVAGTASAHSSDGSDWETKYCKQHPDDKECTPWCLDHPKKDLCSDNLSKDCKKFLKKACPAKHLEEACDYWFGGDVQHNNCIVSSHPDCSPSAISSHCSRSSASSSPGPTSRP